MRSSRGKKMTTSAQKIFTRSDIGSVITILESTEGWTKAYHPFLVDGANKVYPIYSRVDGEIVKYGITPGGRRGALHILYGEDVPGASIAFVYKSITKLKIPNYRVAASIAGACARAKNIDLVTGEHLNIGNILSVLMHFPGLETVTAEYQANPDPDVEFVGDIEQQGSVTTVKGDFNPPVVASTGEAICTRAEMVTLAYYVLLMINKNLDGPGSDEHHKNFTDGRLKSFLFTTVGGATCDHTQLPSRVTGALLMSNKMAHYPNLKTSIFTLLLASGSPEAVHAKGILKDTSMTPFVMVDEFIAADELTLLHLVPAVVTELLKFISLKKRVVEKFGEFWPFYKLLEPRGTESSLKAYKELTKASLAWKLAKGEMTIASYKGAQLYERYKTLALTPIPDEMKSSSTMTVWEGIRKIQQAGYYTAIDLEAAKGVTCLGPSNQTSSTSNI
uniref:Putative nucleoprotein n=1 Tax=Bolahun virus variant 1 TaxID=1903426 RepID=A0A1C9U5C2_9VIRU|nr:putative nucleoprotein [Bolahun virus variant 1]